jgi:hypothetical protein
LVTAELAPLELAAAFGSLADPQARLNPKIEQNKTNKNFFNIKKILAD